LQHLGHINKLLSCCVVSLLCALSFWCLLDKTEGKTPTSVPPLYSPSNSTETVKKINVNTIMDSVTYEISGVSNQLILSRVPLVTWQYLVECLFNTLAYLACPWPSYNYSLYSFTTYNLETLSSDFGILYYPSWQTNLHFCLPNSGLCRTPCRELLWTEL
jgi:hypothetical protein